MRKIQLAVLLLATLVGAVIPAVTWQLRPASDLMLQGVVLIAVLLLIPAVGWFFDRVLKIRDFFNPLFTFPAAFSLFYFASFLNLVDYSPVLPPPSATMGLLALAGLSSYLLAVLMARTIWPTDRLRLPVRVTTHWSSDTTFAVLMVFGAASIAGLLIAFRAAGFVPVLADDPALARFAFASDIGPLLNLMARLVILSAIGFGLYLYAARFRTGLLTVLAVVMFVVQLGGALAPGHRGPLLLISVLLLVLFHYLVRPMSFRTLTTLASVLLIGAGVFNYARFAAVPERLLTELSHSRMPSWMPDWFFFALTFVSFGPLTFNYVLSVVPDVVPYQLGKAHFDAAFGILPGHQPAIGEFVSLTLLHRPTGSAELPPTLLGGLYIDFGVPGIIVGMACLGVVTQFLYWRLVRRTCIWSVFLYAYWNVNLVISLYGDLVQNSFSWIAPLIVYGIHICSAAVFKLAPSDPRVPAARSRHQVVTRS